MIPRTAAHQAPLSIGLSRQECWSELPFLSPGDLPNPGMEAWVSCTAGRFFTDWATREASVSICPLLVGPPSPHSPTSLGHHSALSWAPGTVEQVPISHLFYTWYIVVRILQSPRSVPHHHALTSILHLCISSPALQIGSSVPFILYINTYMHKLGSRLPGEISTTSDLQMTPPLWQKVRMNWKASW